MPRLLALARLTPAQAVEIATGLLAEAVERPQPRTEGPVGELPLAGSVLIDTAGCVVWVPSADGHRGGRAAGTAATGQSVAAVIAGLAAAARGPARSTGPAGEELLTMLDRAAANLPIGGSAVSARMLQEAAAGIDRTAVRAELGALVRAIAGDVRPVSPSPACTTVGGAQCPSTRAPATRPTAHEKSRAGRRRVGAWLLSILAVAAVMLLEVAVLRGRIDADVRMLLSAGHSGTAPAAESKPDGGPIEVSAPAAAGAVHEVDLRPFAGCSAGAPCNFRVLVRLAPATHSRAVSWSYRVVDRCTGATRSAPGGSVTVPAGVDQAAAVGIVSLPAKQAVAVVAVTDVPAVAASPPVSVGSCQSHQ